MGYTANFEGCVRLDKPLTVPQFSFLKAFSESRRMQRDAKKVEKLTDKLREAVGLPVGIEGGYYVAGGLHGTTGQEGIKDHNKPPKGQPGLWCQWVPTSDGCGIQWDGGEKFYDYVAWMKYIIEHFLKPWGITANGLIRWYGEERSDVGTIVVKDNEVTTTHALLNDDAKSVQKTYSGDQVLAMLAQVEGHVSVSGGVVTFATGEAVDLNKLVD